MARSEVMVEVTYGVGTQVEGSRTYDETTYRSIVCVANGGHSYHSDGTLDDVVRIDNETCIRDNIKTRAKVVYVA